jgi:hypothetical protein
MNAIAMKAKKLIVQLRRAVYLTPSGGKGSLAAAARFSTRDDAREALAKAKAAVKEMYVGIIEEPVLPQSSQ